MSFTELKTSILVDLISGYVHFASAAALLAFATSIESAAES